LPSPLCRQRQGPCFGRSRRKSKGLKSAVAVTEADGNVVDGFEIIVEGNIEIAVAIEVGDRNRERRHAGRGSRVRRRLRWWDCLVDTGQGRRLLRMELLSTKSSPTVPLPDMPLTVTVYAAALPVTRREFVAIVPVFTTWKSARVDAGHRLTERNGEIEAAGVRERYGRDAVDRQHCRRHRRQPRFELLDARRKRGSPFSAGAARSASPTE